MGRNAKEPELNMFNRWQHDPLLAVGRHPRYRARRRSEVRTAAQVVGVIVVVVSLSDMINLGGQAPTLLPIDSVEIVLIVAACLLVRGPMRRHPESVTLFIGVVAITGTVLPYVFDRSIAYSLLAYIALILVASALFVPWSARAHLAWVALCLAIVCGLIASPLGASLNGQTGDEGVADLIQISLASACISIAGFVFVERRRLRALAVELQVRSLHERTREQRAELLRLYEELETVARTDALTNTGNRVRMREDEVRLCAADPEANGVRAAALVDLDRFKRYNDRYGHLAGDDVLGRVAAVLRRVPGADVYRFGGEEFLLVASFPSAEDAAGALDAARRAVEELGIAHAENLPWRRVTISTGVDVRDLRVQIDLQSWIRAADGALYRAKAQGRNRLSVVRPDGTEELLGAGRIAEDIPA